MKGHYARPLATEPVMTKIFVPKYGNTSHCPKAQPPKLGFCVVEIYAHELMVYLKDLVTVNHSAW